MKANKITISMLSFIILPFVSAHSQRAYTLEECRAKALTNNVRIKNARNDVDVASQEKKEAMTHFFPSISATGTGFIADKGLIELGLGPENHLSLVDNGAMGSVIASLPLFTGGQIINTNKLAKVSKEIRSLQLKQSENEVLLTTESYYWQIVTLKTKLETLSSVEEMLDNLCKDVRATVDAGIANRNDLLQVQLKQNEMKSYRIQLENALSLSRMVLGQYIGEPTFKIDVATTIAKANLQEAPQSLQCDHNEALRYTNEYRLLNKNVEVSKLKYKKTIGSYLPSLAIGGSITYNNLMDKDQSSWIGFATVSIPISGWWGGTHAIKKDKIQVINVQNELTNNSELLMIKMQKAWNDVNDAYKEIQIAGQSIEQATENLRLNNDYYKAGITTMNELLDSQALFQKSKNQYVEACSQYEIKKREYLQATGR